MKKTDWVKHQKQSRDQLKSLSQQKKQLRLQTLYKTFSKDAVKSKEKLAELEQLVGRIQEKVKTFNVLTPVTQKAIKFVLEKSQKDQLQEESTLMEDLYKIMPLTVDTTFNQQSVSIICVFDTSQDVLMSE